MSIPGRDVTMPVSMGVATFKSNGERENDLSKIPQLDPSKPVWVGIHGMDSNEQGGIENIARELTQYPGMQVVTINWEQAAQAILKSGNDAPWTKAVGEWVARQLIAAGFNPSQINIVGPSHGTYAAFALASEVMRLKDGAQINALIALDPAGNVPALSGFTVGSMDFAQVSRNSLAIEGSLGAGNNALAATADIAFQVDSASTIAPWTEHSLPEGTFAKLLAIGRIMPSQLPPSLRMQNMLTAADRQEIKLQQNVFRDYYEGIIRINTRNAIDAHGNPYLEALPVWIQTRPQGQQTDDIRRIIPLDETIS